MAITQDNPNAQITAAEALAIHRIIKDDGYYADASHQNGIGVTIGAAAADASATYRMPSAGTLKVEAAGAITDGAVVLQADDGKVGAHATVCTAAGIYYKRGVAKAAASASGSIIEIDPIGWGEPVVVGSAAASAEVENTTTETAFDKTVTFPANTLNAGDVIHIRAHVHVVDQNSTDTLTLRLKLGTIELLATAALDVADDDIAVIDAYVFIRTIGASGTLFASITHGFDEAGTAMGTGEKAETAVDTTADLAVSVTAEWSVAHADNEVRLDALVAHVL